jgi:hypothetical protein
MRNNGTSVTCLRSLWLCFFLWVSVPAFGQPPQRIRFASLVSKVEPVYPVAARKNWVQGAVWLDAVIGEDGRVLGVQPISGNPGSDGRRQGCGNAMGLQTYATEWRTNQGDHESLRAFRSSDVKANAFTMCPAQR